MSNARWTAISFLVAVGFSIGSRLMAPAPPPEATDSTLAEVIVPAPPSEVWEAYTTKDGLESWKAAVAEVDLRPGGRIRTTDDGSAGLAGPETVEREVLALDPGRMLSTRVKKPAASFPHPGPLGSVWHVTYFEPTGAKRTKVTTRGLGYASDPESQKLRAHLARLNAESLDVLRKKFAKRGSTDTTDATDASSSSGD